jgi:acetyl-CoA carboxylase biotin carboxyl carrier protein
MQCPGSLPAAGSEASAAVSHTIAAELVANVHTVVAQAGDTVQPTDTLVILESMKMEIPVLAEVFGVVSELAVRPGDVIQEGDVIAVIDETTEGESGA